MCTSSAPPPSSAFSLVLALRSRTLALDDAQSPTRNGYCPVGSTFSSLLEFLEQTRAIAAAEEPPSTLLISQHKTGKFMHIICSRSKKPPSKTPKTLPRPERYCPYVLSFTFSPREQPIDTCSASLFEPKRSGKPSRSLRPPRSISTVPHLPPLLPSSPPQIGRAHV